MTDHINSTNIEKTGWLKEYSRNIIGDISIYSGETNTLSANTFPSLLPMAMKISAQTIGMGGTKKSKEQQLRENRLNELPRH